MAKNTGMYERCLDEILVPSPCHNIVTNDNSIQFARVEHGLLAGFSAAGSGESKVIRERAATLGILLKGFVRGLLKNASILEELGHDLTVFLEASACVESDGDLSTPRHTEASISGPAVVAPSSSGRSSIHQPQHPGVPASINVYRRRGRPRSQQLEPQFGYWEIWSTLQDFHTICMMQLRETKERLQLQEEKHIELMDLLDDRSQKNLKNHR
jgi:hypothetical protein